MKNLSSLRLAVGRIFVMVFGAIAKNLLFAG